MDSAPRQSIIVGVDFSEYSARAASWAAREAADLRLPLRLFHCLQLPASTGLDSRIDYVLGRRTEAAETLDAMADDLRGRYPGLTVSVEIDGGQAADALIRLSTDATLIAVGTHGHGGYAALLLGSVSLALAAKAHCPVVLVRGGTSSRTTGPVVLGVEPGAPEPSVEFAFTVAESLGADLRIVHARPLPPSTGGTPSDFATRIPMMEQDAGIADVLDTVRARHPAVKSTTVFVSGDAVSVLVDAAQDARLLVVGAHRRRSQLSVGLGYVIQGLVSHSPVPVAIVPIA